MDLKERVISEIKKIYDPEIPVNIYELGLIYDITIKDKDVLQELSDLSEAKKKAFIDFLLDLGIRMWKFSRNEIDYQKLDDQREEFIVNVQKAGKDVEDILEDYLSKLLKRKINQ